MKDTLNTSLTEFRQAQQNDILESREKTRANFPGDVAYSIEESCDILNIGKTFLYAELKAGRLKARRCGARRLILASEINRYLLSLPEA